MFEEVLIASSRRRASDYCISLMGLHYLPIDQLPVSYNKHFACFSPKAIKFSADFTVITVRRMAACKSIAFKHKWDRKRAIRVKALGDDIDGFETSMCGQVHSSVRHVSTNITHDIHRSKKW